MGGVVVARQRASRPGRSERLRFSSMSPSPARASERLRAEQLLESNQFVANGWERDPDQFVSGLLRNRPDEPFLGQVGQSPTDPAGVGIAETVEAPGGELPPHMPSDLRCRRAQLVNRFQK